MRIAEISALYVLIGLVGCGEPPVEQASGGLVCHETDVNWGYEGEEDPAHWGDLSDEFVQCAEGALQSPIDFESHKVTTHADGILEFDYRNTSIEVLDNGHTIQANCDGGNILRIHGTTYEMKQFHFHAPSEHQVDGIIYPMELHLVHTNANNEVAVLGFFIKEGIHNELLDVFIRSIPDDPKNRIFPPDEFDFTHLVPNNHTAYHYSGSLTTPPCTEGVEWVVLTTPLELSKAQIARFKEHYNYINRPVQNIGSRVVEVCD